MNQFIFNKCLVISFLASCLIVATSIFLYGCNNNNRFGGYCSRYIVKNGTISEIIYDNKYNNKHHNANTNYGLTYCPIVTYKNFNETFTCQLLDGFSETINRVNTNSVMQYVKSRYTVGSKVTDIYVDIIQNGICRTKTLANNMLITGFIFFMVCISCILWLIYVINYKYI